MMNSSQKEICRLCYYETVDTTDIFSDKGHAFDYIGKINKYLYFSVSDNDALPKTVCWMCTQHLETFHRFYEKINDIQKLHLSKEEYEAVVLRPKYIDREQINSGPEKKNNTIVDDDGNMYEVFVISEDPENKPTIEPEFEEFELLEVDNGDANNQTTEIANVEPLQNETSPVIRNKKANEEKQTEIESMETGELENVEDKAVISTRTRSRRKSRITTKKDSECELQSFGRTTRQTTKMKNDMKKLVQNLKQIKKAPDPVVKSENREQSISKYSTENCVDENMQLDYDGTEGESDNEFPARDSDNEDWPSQETLNEFPKQIIKDGLLQVKGKELMSLICRFYNLECKLCEEKRRFKQLSDLLDHYTNGHKEEGYVECCQTKFTRYPAIIMHMARHLQPDAFKCDECGYVVTRPRFLQSHKQTHLPDDQKPYACTECSRRFCWKSALRIHLISHKPASERRQYICHVCGRTYDTPGGLSTHKKLAHSEAKPLQSNVCHICAKNFSTRTGLHEHMMTIHQPREKGQMQCTECGKWLMNLRCLKTHMVLHSNVEFRCDKCDYVTKKKVLLNRHLVTQHSNVRPYVCDHCGRDFKMKRALTVHVAQHGSTTKYQCPFCQRSFNSSTNFYTHRKNAHPKELAEMKRQEEAERRRKRIEAGVEEGEVDESDADKEQDIVQPIEIQEEDENEESTTFHVTELCNTHLILTTDTGEEYTVLEVKSHENNDAS